MTASENPYRSPESAQTPVYSVRTRKQWAAWMGTVSLLAALTPVLIVGGIYAMVFAGVHSLKPVTWTSIFATFGISILIAVVSGIAGRLLAKDQTPALIGLILGVIELSVFLSLWLL